MKGITLSKLSSNLHEVRLRGLILYFSYETVIGFADKDEAFIMQNQWRTTTGKHLNIIADMYGINRSKESLSKEKFEEKFTELLHKHNLI